MAEREEEITASAEGFYYVHACASAHTQFDEWAGCNGLYVWAPNNDAAQIAGRQPLDAFEDVRADREPRLDAFRASVGDRFSPWRKNTVHEARALRAAGWVEDEDRTCSECLLGEHDVLPESAVCGSCGECRECRPIDSECEECAP